MAHRRSMILAGQQALAQHSQHVLACIGAGWHGRSIGSGDLVKIIVPRAESHTGRFRRARDRIEYSASMACMSKLIRGWSRVEVAVAPV